MKSSIRELKEIKRKKAVLKKQSVADCLASEMNTCQALVRPDCSKPVVQKSLTIKTALKNLLTLTETSPSSRESFVYNSLNDIPLGERKNIKAVVVEFAGIKFKLKDTIKTGGQYITYAKDFVIKHYLHVTPNINRMVLCEEKYRFTPDDLKAETRANRNKKVDVSISHLKTDDEMVSSENIDTTAIKSTGTGRIGIGNYLAEHAGQMQINHNLTLDIDSEYNLHQCQCLASSEYECRCEDINKAYATPVRYKYCQHEAVTRQHLQDIIQRKGEAEISQLDWLMDCATSLESSESIVSAVTSGDIDSVIIHLFALSHLFPRNSEGKFKAHVYVYLQTPGTT